MAEAARDQNHITAALGVSSTNSALTLPLQVDPITGRLLTDFATGAGDVVGPASATDNAIARFDGTTGKIIQNSVITIADTTGNMAGVGTINTLTLPSSNFVGISDVQTFTNKTYDTAGTGNSLLINGVAVTANTGTGAVVRASSPTITTAVLGSSTATTQAPSDNSTKLATTAYVDAAVLGQNFKEAAKYASTAALPALVYNNGSSGVGATLTGVAFGAITFDGSTPSVNDRVLVKNQVSTFQNGIYTVTVVGTAGTVFVLTRTTDANQSSEYKTGDSLFVTSGTTNSATTWAYTGIDSPTMGTDALTFVQTAGQGSFTSGNGITITGNSIAIDTSVTVDKTTVQTLTNKTLTSPVLTTPTLGVAAATTVNKLTITTPASGSTLTIIDGKTLTVNKTLTLDGTDSTTITFPSTSATVARTDAAQTFTGTQTFAQVITTANAITASSNAATVPVTSRHNIVTNSSAATLTITLTTTSAVNMQTVVVQILDFSAVAQTITWVNTENSTVTVPATSNGSTTLPLTVGFMYNSGTSKWRCIASA